MTLKDILFSELPSILENPVKAACINRIKQCQLKGKKECGRSKICRDTDFSYHTSSTRCGLESHMHASLNQLLKYQE